MRKKLPNPNEFNDHVVLVPPEIIPKVYPHSKAKALIEFSRLAVESCDVTKVRRLLHALLKDPARARRYSYATAFSVGGYYDDPRYLSEIPEVVAFARALLEEVPEWLFLIERDPVEVNMWLAILTGARGKILPNGTLHYLYDSKEVAKLVLEIGDKHYPAAFERMGYDPQAPGVKKGCDDLFDIIGVLLQQALEEMEKMDRRPAPAGPGVT